MSLRILFGFVGGVGHFAPLEPLAVAATAAGHELAFACGSGMADVARAAGFRVFVVGEAPGSAPRRTALLELDPAREERDLRERFVRGAARHRAPRLASLCKEWQPDLVVCDETDFGAMLAAELHGVPHATVQVIAAGSFVRRDVVGEALAELRAQLELPADPSLEMLQRWLVVSPFPASLRDPAHPAPPTLHAIRPPLAAASGDAHGLRLARPDAPVVYLTLGTVFNLESGDLLERLLEGVSALDVNLIATVGPGIDPLELGDWPEWVRVERFRPQEALLPHCDLVVSHAGSGSLMGALAHGLPSVLVPMGADQPANAARAAQLGVARVLDAVRVTPAEAGACVREALADPELRTRAEWQQSEIRALPPVSHGVALLERLAATGAPVRAIP